MQISKELAEAAQKAAKKYKGQPVPLEGISGYFLADPGHTLSEKDKKIVIIGIDGKKYLIYTHLNGGL